MLFAKHLFLNVKYLPLLQICSWDLYLISVFSTGPCSPMRETAMTFALQKKGVSWHCCQVFMLLMPRNYQMCKGISLSAYSRRAGVNTQSVACHAPDPSICKGRKPTVTQLTTATIWCFSQTSSARWRTGGVGGGAEQRKSHVCILPSAGSKLWSA